MKVRVSKEEISKAVPGIEWREFQFVPQFLVIEAEPLDPQPREEEFEACGISLGVNSTCYNPKDKCPRHPTASPTEECCEKCFCNKSHGSGSKIGHCENLDCSCHQKEQPYCNKCGHPKNMGKTSRCDDAFHKIEGWGGGRRGPVELQRNKKHSEEQPKSDNTIGRARIGHILRQSPEKKPELSFEEQPRLDTDEKLWGALEKALKEQPKCTCNEVNPLRKILCPAHGVISYAKVEEQPKCECLGRADNVHHSWCSLPEEQRKCECGKECTSLLTLCGKCRKHACICVKEHPEKPKVITKLDEGSWVDPRRESTELRAKINELVDALSALTKSHD